AASIAKALNVSVASTGAPTNGFVQYNFTGAHTGNGIEVDDVTATGTVLNVTGNSITSGTGVAVASSGAAVTGDLQNITLSGSNAANTGNLLTLNSSGAASIAKLLNVTSASTGAFANGGVRFSFSGA